MLRLREGDSITLTDSAARTFAATILASGSCVRVRLDDELLGAAARTEPFEVDLAQAVPKGNRMDFVIEKGSELGVRRFLPFYSERSVGRDVGAEKLARWRRIARTAAQQCGRSRVAELFEPLTFAQLAARFGEYDAVLFAWELATPASLRERLTELLPKAGAVLIVVGPEGGFTHEEAERAKTAGAALLWLGPRVLRTDTAALVVLAVIEAFAS